MISLVRSFSYLGRRFKRASPCVKLQRWRGTSCWSWSPSYKEGEFLIGKGGGAQYNFKIFMGKETSTPFIVCKTITTIEVNEVLFNSRDTTFSKITTKQVTVVFNSFVLKRKRCSKAYSVESYCMTSGHRPSLATESLTGGKRVKSYGSKCFLSFNIILLSVAYRPSAVQITKV